MATKHVIHVRRCHVCGTVTEKEGAAVDRCSKCGKHLAPFYFFEESRLEGVSDDRLEMSLWPQATTQADNYRPLWGFSTYWQEVRFEREETDRESRGNRGRAKKNQTGHSGNRTG